MLKPSLSLFKTVGGSAVLMEDSHAYSTDNAALHASSRVSSTRKRDLENCLC